MDLSEESTADPNSHFPIYLAFFLSYTSYIAGIGLRRALGGQKAYQAVRLKDIYLLLIGFLVPGVRE